MTLEALHITVTVVLVVFIVGIIGGALYLTRRRSASVEDTALDYVESEHVEPEDPVVNQTRFDMQTLSESFAKRVAPQEERVQPEVYSQESAQPSPDELLADYEDPQAHIQFADDQTLEWKYLVKDSYQRRAEPSDDFGSTLEPLPQVIVMHLMAGRNRTFKLSDVLNAFSDHGLLYGQYHIFHAFDTNGSVRFSAASAVEPGTFDLERPHASLPGLSFFVDFHKARHPKTAFKSMLATLYDLSQQLQADIVDDHHHRLTQHRITSYWAQIKALTSEHA
jgi:FtsZ-interacting cell division protein ZipA